MTDHQSEQQVEDYRQYLSRRSLLLGAGSLAVSSLLAGCSGQSASALKLLLLRGSVPSQLAGEFERAFKQQSNQTVSLAIDSRPQLQELFSWLQTQKQAPPKSEATKSFWESWFGWLPFGSDQGNPVTPDLVTLGDAWLGKAVEQKLLSPLDVGSLSGWTQLAQIPQLKQLVTRDRTGTPDSNGQVWAVPYRLGTTAIAYRRDLFAQRQLSPPIDWDHLWRPELKRHITLFNHARIGVGLTLKKLGHSCNTKNPSAITGLRQELSQLQQQILFYSSDSYLQPLLLKDAWVSVGWSTDLLRLAQRNPQIAVVVPKSGTILWADLWVCPSDKTALSAVAKRWIEFCWQKEIAAQLSAATWAVSPGLIGTEVNKLPDRFRDFPALLPDTSVLQASEFLLPLPKASLDQYRQLWAEMRRGSLRAES